jgi:UDP-N-acetylglucosamine 2-epimerase (non-hydrolysing)
MIDNYEMLRGAIEADGTRAALGVTGRRYGVVTLHRPSNVDTRDALAELVAVLCEASRRLPLIFAVHPRTRKRLQDFGLEAQLVAGAIQLIEPLGYIQFMNLVTGAAAAITDSGGVQEETTYLGIPCLTLRENTERPVTVTVGSNRLVTVGNLTEALDQALAVKGRLGRRPELWDGRAADRAVQSLRRHCGA